MEFKIFGCKVNKYYTDKWLNSDFLKKENGVFIASCVVTDKAKRKWLKYVKDIFKRENFTEDKKVFISGCGAFKSGVAQGDFFEIYPELKKYNGRIVILGEDPSTTQKQNPPAFGIPLIKGDEETGRDVSLKHLNNNLNEKITKLKGIYTKKFVLIQGGCDSFCTFCLTVIKRGRHFSRSKEDILKEILDFEKEGGKEVVLTGVNLSAWGLDNTNQLGESRFAELLEYLLKNSNIKRIRISSMGPEFIDDKCLEIFKNKRIYPHFHYSVQSGSSEILKLMRRHYDGKYIKDLLEKTINLKREDLVKVSIGADIIVGFPGETEKNFKETLSLLESGLITKLHAFPFSAHQMGETVPASKFHNQIDEKIKQERMKILLEKGEEVRNNFINSEKGKTFEVLVEIVKPHPNPLLIGEGKRGIISFKGWTENYIEITEKNFEIISPEIKKNEIIIGKLK